jgi:hypothetical protein
MQVQKIQENFAKYRQFLQSAEAHKRLYLWEIQQHFQNNWDLEADDLAGMYDRSLQSKHTRRHWRRESYEPKQVMMGFMELDADYLRQIFKDLFNERNEIGGRVDRFLFHCNQLMKEYKRKNPLSIDNRHYHDDGYQMISLYLTLRFPDQYTLYEGNAFRELLIRLGTRNLPQVDDFERFCKISRTLYKLMQREEDLLELHQARLDPGRHYMGESLLVVYDFYMEVISQ